MHFTRRRLFVLSTAALSAAALPALTAGCSSTTSASSEPTTQSSAAASFPVTLTHVFGETVIPAEPQRVLTWGYAAADAVLALGVVPVAIPAQTYGGDDAGVLPWIADQLTALGAAVPTILANADGSTIPFEEIAAATPDVILAPYSGITEGDYAKLAKIAPTVAYPEVAWSTPWRDVVTIVGTALGRKGQAEQLLADSAAVVKQKASEHPELAGKSVAAASEAAGVFYVYREADPRVEFLTDLGLVNARAVEELANGDSTFFYSLSHEELDKLTSDVIVLYAASQDELDSFLAASYAKAMAQVSGKAYAPVVGEEQVTAVSPPTILSITWKLDDFLASLSKAARGEA